jgi:hypothetical protein
MVSINSNQNVSIFVDVLKNLFQAPKAAAQTFQEELCNRIVTITFQFLLHISKNNSDELDDSNDECSKCKRTSVPPTFNINHCKYCWVTPLV